MKIWFLVLFYAFHASANTYQEQVLNELKQRCRSRIQSMNHCKSQIQSNDRAELLVDYPDKMIKSALVISQKGLDKAELAVLPWSDYYWPLSKGAIANRYNLEDQAETWKERYDDFTKNPISQFIKEWGADNLSPAEKYDYLFTKNFPMTKNAWEEGKFYNDQYGEVETWMGLCHGWSAASLMEKEPVKKISVSNSQKSITFYPSDLKAMATSLWASGSYEAKFVGGRCDSKESSTNRSNNDCLDTNPGTFHLILANQIGQFKRGFVMDVEKSFEVWNQPVAGYSFVYMNPKTNVVGKFDQSVIKKSEYPQDPSKSVRAPNTFYLVKVKAKVKYGVEIYPNHEEGEQKDFMDAVYEYDLELDENYQIVGGEWISSKHPDFIWVPSLGTKVMVYGDKFDGMIMPEKLSPEQSNAIQLNAQKGVPLRSLVRELINRSSN